MAMQMPMQQVPWLRDIFPDMIWLAMLMTEYGGAKGMYIAASALRRIDSILDDPSGPGRPDKLVLAGQLTEFERVPEALRGQIIEALQADDLFERAVPWIFARALMKYENVPGMWLFNGWQGNEQIVSADQPERLLARVVEDNSHGQSASATRAKAMVLAAWLNAGKVTISREMAEEWGKILPRYPDGITDDERRRIEPSIRVAFMAMAAQPYHVADDGTEPAALVWAKNFWRSNWQLYDCKTATDEIEHEEEGDHRETEEAIRQARAEWTEQLDALSAQLLKVSRETDPDLYCPDRHEVLTGIAHRMIRALSVLVDYPGLWTMEHAASYIRALVEARIVLKWLAHKDEAELYARFKAYGRGRLKLLKLHLEEYRDGLTDPPPDMDSHIEYLDALVNQDIWEEFQDISIEGNFAGIDTRRMADQVGMLTAYRLVFAPTSANVHGEWAALDQYALMTCRNPLHRGHRIPRDDVKVVLGPELVETALSHASVLVEEYVASMNTEAGGS